MKDFTKRIPELDGIRGTAILFVILFHWAYAWGHADLTGVFSTR
jgi:peptidoglycan/LPS O-acetylase OafA/YrhL